MKIFSRELSPRYQRDNIESFLLVSSKTCNSKNLSVTLVEMEAGGTQHIHQHGPEQTYFILRGFGLMSVGGEEEKVIAGDCIFIPSNVKHGLKNTGASVLKYISACSPSFTAGECEELWPLKSLE
jgi:mannose-6-phosphate isomerase-like protein (cupin superfamily)